MSEKRAFDLPETRGTFQIAGVVSGTEKDNFSKEFKTKTGKPMRSLYFNVNYDDKKSIGISLSGFEKEDVYVSKTEGTGKDKKTITQTVKWNDRFTKIPEGFRIIGVNVGVKKTLNEKGEEVNDKKIMTEFDACKEIAENLSDGKSVFTRGKIDYSTYEDKRYVKFVPSQISLCKDIDFTKEDYSPKSNFTQRIVFTDINPNDNGDFVVSAKIINYNSIEDAEFYIYDKQLATLFKKSLKPYTVIDVWGSIEMKLNTEEVDNSNAVWGQSNQMERQLIPAERRLIIEGADPTSIDTETYSKDKIEKALSNIIQSKKSENDFANKNTWGSNSADNFGDIDDDDDPWG